jgi:hypothetical protein
MGSLSILNNGVVPAAYSLGTIRLTVIKRYLKKAGAKTEAERKKECFFLSFFGQGKMFCCCPVYQTILFQVSFKRKDLSVHSSIIPDTEPITPSNVRPVL